MHGPPTEPDARLVPFTPVAQRSLSVFGAPASLVFVPGRKARQTEALLRPAFLRSPVDRIVAEEALWRGDGLVLTPNRYPFAREQRILWPTRPHREPDVEMWSAIGSWVDATSGSALVNTIGAASSIARAHAHLLPERLPFLAALPERRTTIDLIDLPHGIELVQKHVPFCLLGLRGEAKARAEALVAIAGCRMCTAWNVVVQEHTAWVYPRRLETPAPHFPFALGAAEVWGRWCYVEEAPFARATTADLERALVAAGMEPLG